MPMTAASPKIYTPRDIPRPGDMSDYLHRVRAVCACLPVLPGVPGIPDNMSRLTYQSANDIELALLGAERVVNSLDAGWFYAGEIQSGGF